MIEAAIVVLAVVSIGVLLWTRATFMPLKADMKLLLNREAENLRTIDHLNSSMTAFEKRLRDLEDHVL